MSSDSEYDDSHICYDKDSSSETDEEYNTYNGVYKPYEDEPLADNINDTEEAVEEADIDGLTPSILEEWYEKNCHCRFLVSIIYSGIWNARRHFMYLFIHSVCRC